MKKINKTLFDFYLYKYKWYFICISIILILGTINNRFIESIIFLVGFKFFRYIFPSTLHLDKFKECLISSILLLICGISICLQKNISIYSSLLLSFLLCLMLYLINYIIVLISPKKEKHNRDKIIEILNSNTSQEHIFEYCRNKGLKQNIADSIDLFLNNTIQETSEILNVDISTIKRRINTFIESANK